MSETFEFDRRIHGKEKIYATRFCGDKKHQYFQLTLGNQYIRFTEQQYKEFLCGQLAFIESPVKEEESKSWNFLEECSCDCAYVYDYKNLPCVVIFKPNKECVIHGQ